MVPLSPPADIPWSLHALKYVLAPLAGFTNAAFRRLCARRGAALSYTEMVSAAGLAHGSSPTRHLMETLPGEGPVVCQLFGSRPDELAFAAREATMLRSISEDAPDAPRFCAIDLNAGCPMPKIVKEGAGAALVRDPQLVYDCLKAMKAETSLPLTLKTRPGPRPDKIVLFELLDAAESAGCAGMTLHARFTSQMHSGETHLDLLAELVQRSRIPITGNGGVYNRSTAELMAATGVEAIMIGRAAMANPWIFADLADPTRPEDAADADDRRRRLQNEVFREHLESALELQARLARLYPEDHVPSVDDFVAYTLHTHLFRYFNRRANAAGFRKRLGEIRTLAEVRALMAEEMTS